MAPTTRSEQLTGQAKRTDSVAAVLRFRQQFFDWIDDNLSGRLPKRVSGLLFGLVEHELGYSIELTGTEEFDPADDGWTWTEAWEPRRKDFAVSRIDALFGRPAMEVILGEWIAEYIDGGFNRRKLEQVDGVAFCDPEMTTRVLMSRIPLEQRRPA